MTSSHTGQSNWLSPWQILAIERAIHALVEANDLHGPGGEALLDLLGNSKSINVVTYPNRGS